MQPLVVIEDAKVAEVTLDPIRARLLAALREPRSATSLAAEVGLSRQKVNYHLRALEHHGLIELVEERRKGNMTERILQASASSFVISPNALALVAPDPSHSPDRRSAEWLLALASRAVGELGELLVRSAHAKRPLATFGIDVEVEFATAADRAAFAAELTDAVEGLVAKYQMASRGSRRHRCFVGLHPMITKPSPVDPASSDVAAASRERKEP